MCKRFNDFMELENMTVEVVPMTVEVVPMGEEVECTFLAIKHFCT